MSRPDAAPWSQSAHGVRVEWGLPGALAVAPGVRWAVVIDVLSFSTTVTVALDQGLEVLPYRWRDGSAAAYARDHSAALAVGRHEARDAGLGEGFRISLSPAHLRAVEPARHGISRIVLPSPNGSAICFGLAERGVTVVAASLRNRRAVATWLADLMHDEPGGVAVIAAGERWREAGSLRPALEDQLGAGAVVAALQDRGLTAASPEAEAAAAVFRGLEGRLAEMLRTCASGRELIAAGFRDDVEVAVELDSSDRVPLLADGAFRDVAGGAASGTVATVGA